LPMKYLAIISRQSVYLKNINYINIIIKYNIKLKIRSFMLNTLL